MLIQTECGDHEDAIADGKIQSEESCRYFSLAEIQSATNKFDDNLVIGKGGFGKVYKGFIDHGDTIVAIKRLNAESKQGAREFWTEIVTLSKLRHTHLVTLIGYCDELEEMILVYEYMPNGTLADHLYRLSRKGNRGDIINHQFSWEERLKICIGAARGLDYLHTNTEQSVIHRDIKTTNILLDDNWVAKISDFGLSKICTTHTHSHVSTDIRGTFGYLDPEYFLTRRLTKKSDVYAFGVVLIEALCARPPVDASVEEDQCSLAVWALKCIKKGTLDQIIDPSLRGQISPSCLKGFAEVASKCLHNHPKGRPTMAEVVESLELVLDSHVPRSKGVITRLFGQILHIIARSFDIGWIKWKNYWSKSRESLQLWRDPFPGSGIKLYRRFTLSEIRSATNNFHEHLVLGDGGWAKVYRGLIDKGNLEVAIKRCKEGSSNERNSDQFRAEIQVQSQLRYRHIASLIGYCNDKHELILVYDYMVHGSLYHHLYETNDDPLPWKKRLEICTDVARGLQYLHAGTKQAIIHHNVKTTSILLDENWVAKLAGFESSTVLPNNESSTVSTFVAGTVGYMDPGYLASANLTIKSDVYSFGVILLELLCGRKPMIYSRDENQVNLVRWFKTNIEMGTVDQIIDLYLIDKIAPECLDEYIKIAENCVRDEGRERPSMDNVLGNLWCALQLQEIWQNQNQFANLPQPEPESVSHNVIIDIASGGATKEMSFTDLEDSDYFSGNLAR